ncbi:lipoyl(octanoyl) transferase [Taibaiella chishuiensis]|uniref:Octanoyltransferase n=2 Tax=Taibaiella chishuiensis TaxID=1434707 RepID=A0A2P8D9L6_9BACT|nr:lipoyl(octanoyl) transferase [Taibaiella chishuiensis]
MNVLFEDLGKIEYGAAWDLQETYMKQGLDIKSARFNQEAGGITEQAAIPHYLFLCEHPHVYTLGKSGVPENLLINDQRMKDLDISYYKTNRGGDITYHGPGQMVAYPVLDLEQIFTDLGRYMRSLEEAVILALAEYGISSGRLEGSTGVWLDAGIPGKARKICAMGVRSSRWITIHGLALNVNTQMQYFDYIVPCGISDKGVTSMQRELGREVDMEEVKALFLKKFEQVFGLGIVALTDKEKAEAI